MASGCTIRNVRPGTAHSLCQALDASRVCSKPMKHRSRSHALPLLALLAAVPAVSYSAAPRARPTANAQTPAGGLVAPTVPVVAPLPPPAPDAPVADLRAVAQASNDF